MEDFKLPIFYVKNKYKLEETIKDDLEMNEMKSDISNNLLKEIYLPDNKIEENILKYQNIYFTDDIKFLKDSQKLVKKWKCIENEVDINNKNEIYNKFVDLWKTFECDEDFVEKYYYIDIGFFKFLNKSSYFLQILSLYNLFSPIVTLFLPVLLLIVPFFILKIKGHEISLSKYIEILQIVLSKHALGNIFAFFQEGPMDKKIYAVISILFFVFQIYQNCLICYRFYNNFKNIHQDIFLIKDYLKKSLENIERYEKIGNKLKTFNKFNKDVSSHKERLIFIINKLEEITPYKLSGNKVNQIGYIMKYYYDLHQDIELKQTINYTIGLNGYIDVIEKTHKLHRSKYINACKYSKGKMKVCKGYFPSLMRENPIKNDVLIDKNIIITGPNAAGKTTLLKSVLFNIIFSQQIGFGFYEKCELNPYQFIHSYINIPDTSGRDSLFQAEARRCKEIVDSLENNKRHFCIFDELYSGTNPYEAVASATAFINYLINKGNIDFILTTHLVDICTNLDRIMNNKHMQIIKNNNHEFTYTYLLKEGICKTRGGLKVLKDLNYPEVIIKETEKLLE
jgi:hypothetical protein